MRRILTLFLLSVVVMTFAVGGCSEESCKDLFNRLDALQDRIIQVGNDIRALDAAKEVGTANKIAKLRELETGLRGQFAQIEADYIAKGCEERTGDPVPPLPPQQPITQTPF